MIVEFQDVVKEYGSGEALQKAVDHVSFGIEEGELVVILGQSGAGKSTVLNLLGGMDSPTLGRVIVDGTDVRSCAVSGVKHSAAASSTVASFFLFFIISSFKLCRKCNICTKQINLYNYIVHALP